MGGKSKRAVVAAMVGAVALLSGLGVVHAGFSEASVGSSVFGYGSWIGGIGRRIRASSDSTQYVRCSVERIGGGGTQPGHLYTSCSARHADGRTFACQSTDPEHARVVLGAGPDDYLGFINESWRPAQCHRILVVKSSTFLAGPPPPPSASLSTATASSFAF